LLLDYDRCLAYPHGLRTIDGCCRLMIQITPPIALVIQRTQNEVKGTKDLQLFFITSSSGIFIVRLAHA
jgi:hypothetical protein